MSSKAAEHMLHTFEDMVASKLKKIDKEDGIIKIKGTELYTKAERSSSTFYAIGGWDYIEDQLSYVKYGNKRDGKVLVKVDKAREEHGL